MDIFCCICPSKWLWYWIFQLFFTFWLFVFTQLETWRTAVPVNNNSWCALCACKCLLVLNAFFVICLLTYKPCLLSCLVHPPPFHSAMMRTVSCRQHADSSNPPTHPPTPSNLDVQEAVTHLSIGKKTAETPRDFFCSNELLLNKEWTLYAGQFVPQRHEAKQEM